MQKNKIIGFLLLTVLTALASKAERTSGYCSMSEEEKGREVLSLNPGVNFYCREVSSLKLRIWIDSWVRTIDFYDGIKLQVKTKLYNESGKILGRVTYAFNPMKILEETDSMTHIVVSGYLDKNCSDQNFLAEKELELLLEKAENNEKTGYFEAYLKKYTFKETIENNQYTSYLIVEPEFTTQVMLPRLLMVFYKKELIAIFHTRELKVKKYDSIEMGSQYKMIYNSKFSEHTKKEMVDIYKKKLN